MDLILNVTAPVFGMVLFGWMAARFGFFDEGAIRGLSGFVFNFAIPMLLFRTLAQTDLPNIEWRFLVAYYLGTFIAFGIGMIIARLLFKLKLDGMGIFGMGCGFSNTVLIGVPLILNSFGDSATLPLFLLIAFHSSLLFTGVTLIVELSRGGTSRLQHLPLTILRAVLKNPIVIGLLLGVFFNVSGLPLSGPIDSIAASMSQAALPCATFAMGAALSRYQIAGSLFMAVVMVSMKNLLHPLLVWISTVWLFQIEPAWANVAILLAAMPMGVNVYLFAQRYEVCTAAAATGILLSTALSVVTVSVLVIWLAG